MTEEERFMGPNILQGDWGQTSQFFDFLTVSEKRHSQPPTIDRTEYEDCVVELRSFLSRHRCHLSGEYAVVSQAGFLHSVLESHTGTWLTCCQVRDEQRQCWPFISQSRDPRGHDTWREAVDLANEDSHWVALTSHTHIIIVHTSYDKWWNFHRENESELLIAHYCHDTRTVDFEGNPALFCLSRAVVLHLPNAVTL